jgi:hypothetical protein
MAEDCKKENCNPCRNAILVPTTYSNNPEACPVSSETCSEIFDIECICWTGVDICEFNIKKGDRLRSIIDKLFLGLNTLGCEYSNSLATIETLEQEITNLTSQIQSIPQPQPLVNYFAEDNTTAVIDSSTYYFPHVNYQALSYTNPASVSKTFIVHTNFTIESDGINEIINTVFGGIIRTDVNSIDTTETEVNTYIETTTPNPGTNGANVITTNFHIMKKITLQPNETVSLKFRNITGMSGTNLKKAQFFINELNN